MNKLYETDLGQYYIADSIELLKSQIGAELKNKVQLILTSPPFPLNNKKKYGNLKGELYKKWFVSMAKIFSDMLTDDGSIVIELGNSWEPGRPIQSLLHLECLLEFVKVDNAKLSLCQEFICYNPARLPSPAEWVTINRIRTTDSFTHVWWMSKSDYPKADNRKVLRPYSKSMENLLKRKKYNSGMRPSEHNISQTSFFTDNGGSIMHNFIEMEPVSPNRDPRLPKNVLNISNTMSNDIFLRSCRERGVRPHPARMQPALASFFIEFLTDTGDLVLDPFAGSNTTGYCAERLKRRWIGIDMDVDYGRQSMLRFDDPQLETSTRYYGA